MAQPQTAEPVDAEIRFLEYRLHVISEWPASRRRQVTLEAVSRRLAAIARSSLNRAPGHEDLLNLSCRLLDGVFYAGPGEPQKNESLV
ncbi:MAG TPA: hypothetical protein VFA04_15435 [Bryobacteraceae bacterium]|nr:hypothetical protein [Bryobacteraceae bacterium]